MIPLQNTTQQPSLASLSNRATRQALFENAWNRAERGDANDTRDTIARLAQLRAQKAKLLGYPELRGVEAGGSDGQDAGSGAQIHGRAGARGNRQSRRARRRTSRRLSTRNTADSRSSRGTGTSMPSRCARRNTIWTKRRRKPYFELNNVLHNGVFYAANQLYGLTFKQRTDIPVYDPDVQVL